MVFELPPMGPKVGIFTISPDIEKLSVGDKKLDIFLEGGLLIRSNNLLLGPPGDEKLLFSLQFIEEGLKKGEPAVIITADDLPKDIEKKALSYKWNLENKRNTNLLTFIDCYSWTLGKGIEEDRKDILIQGPNALNDLSLAISQTVSSLSRPEKPIRICFNSLSTFLLYNPKESIFKFIQITGARLKTMGATSIFLLEEGMHDKKTATTIKHLMDEILYLTKIKRDWYINSESSTLPEGIKITIDEKGFHVL